MRTGPETFCLDLPTQSPASGRSAELMLKVAALLLPRLADLTSLRAASPQPPSQQPSDGAGPRRRQAKDPVLGPAGQSAAGGQAAGRPWLCHPSQDTASREHCRQVLPTGRRAEAGPTETRTINMSQCLSLVQFLTVTTRYFPAGGPFLQHHRPADDSISETHDARSGLGL